MAPTSDERREVAEQLREARPSTYYAEELAELIEDSLLPAFPTETWREPTDVLSALADLIDPTCEMTDASWDNGECTWGCICSACDAHIEHEQGRFLDYCPSCGARVVSHDDN